MKSAFLAYLMVRVRVLAIGGIENSNFNTFTLSSGYLKIYMFFTFLFPFQMSCGDILIENGTSWRVENVMWKYLCLVGYGRREKREAFCAIFNLLC